MAQWSKPKNQDTRPARVRLKCWRERTGLSVEQAAMRLSVSLLTYQRWESGERVPQVITAINLESSTGIQWDAWMSGREGWRYDFGVSA